MVCSLLLIADKDLRVETSKFDKINCVAVTHLNPFTNMIAKTIRTISFS